MAAIQNRVLWTQNNTSTFPYVSNTCFTGVGCINRGLDTVTIYVGSDSTKIKITIRPGEFYTGDFHPFKEINATGTDFEIELRG